MKQSRSIRVSAFLFTFAMVILAAGAGCLRAIDLHRVDTPAGPGVEGCVTIASATPSATPTSIASAAPKAGPGL